MNKIAVLLTCFNRVDKTSKCLHNLYKIDSNLKIFLVDDASTDSTAQIIGEYFPQVIIIRGSGNLYWNRGMNLAWTTAAESDDFDFYLWLNDDVLLYEDSLKELFECSRIKNHQAIISGIIESKNSEKVLYGGSDKNKIMLQPNHTIQEIKFMNGNVVLIPKEVFQTIGYLDPIFHHDLGDVDYGLRAIENNFKVYTTRKAVAIGEANPQCRVRLENSNMSKRFKKLYSPLGSNPFINFHFRKRHYGTLNASIYFIFQHFLNVIPDNLNKALFKDRYVIK